MLREAQWLWVIRCYVQSLAIYPPAGLSAIEHSEQDSLEVAGEAASKAGGVGGGQYAGTPAKAKSWRWRDGDNRSDKASGAASGVVEHPTR